MQLLLKRMYVSTECLIFRPVVLKATMGSANFLALQEEVASMGAGNIPYRIHSGLFLDFSGFELSTCFANGQAA